MLKLGDPSPRWREGEKGDKPLFHQSERGKISGRLWSENKEQWINMPCLGYFTAWSPVPLIAREHSILELKRERMW